MERTLLLNSTYEPLLVITWRKAIVLMCLEKVETLAHYERRVRSTSMALNVPAVVRLFKRVRYRPSTVRFNRTNIYTRDKYTCQYCGTVESRGELTYDHVVPRSRGGKTSWTNIVTCCKPCNRRKGNRTPAEARMKLLRPPVKPDWLPVLGSTLITSEPPEAWKPFLW